MKTKSTLLILSVLLAVSVFCKKESGSADGGMASIAGDDKTIVKIAAGSKDHTTLVAAVQAAGLVDVLANPGPFTVFAPTNAAFEKLPAGTVDNLLKPSQKDALENILYYHVMTSAYRQFEDGQELNMFAGGTAKIKIQNGVTYINGAKILATIPASNGIVYVIDGVLLPPEKK